MTAEQARLQEAREQTIPWKKWGPYLSERQWGTVREDYSEGGNAWDYFSHDQARSRAYRWGEDGLAGISDDKQRLCFALALWNGKDPILKERLFGLTNGEGNHGEDVKEYYFYLDSTPTHSYMKYLYKYPQAAFPYADLVETSRQPRPRRTSSTSCSTPASSTRTATSTSSSSTPRRRPRTSWSGSPSTTAARRRPSCTSCRRCGSATSGPGTPDPSGRRSGRSPATPARGVVQATHAGARGAIPLLRGRRPAAVHRERDEHAADLRRPEPHPVRQGRHQQLRRPRPGRGGQPGEDGDEGRGPLPRHRRPRRVARDPAAALGRRPGGARPHQRRGGQPVRRRVRRGDGGPAQGGGRVLRGGHPGRGRRRRGQRHAAGAGRDDVEQAVLPLRRGQVARGARLRPVQGDAQGRRRGTTTGTTCTTATSSRCRTSGSTRGTRPGTSRSTSSR